MTRTVDLRRLISGLRGLSEIRTAVLGDVMLDHYQFGSVERISPEAPVPVVRVEREEYKLGGAANVARNVVSLGAGVDLVGCCGNTDSLRRIRLLLEQEGIRDCIVEVPSLATTHKTRVIAQSQQMMRIDREDAGENPAAEQTVQAAGHCLQQGSLSLILSDYNKGTLSKQVLTGLARAEGTKPRIFIDPKPENFPNYPAAELITPNRKEAERIWGAPLNSAEEMIRAGDWIKDACQSDNLLLTLGQEGMLLFDQQGAVWQIATHARHVFDVTGAGDTVVAVSSLAMLGGMDPLHACVLANVAAGKVVERVGAASVTQEELREAIRSGDGFRVSNLREGERIESADAKP